MKFIPFDIILLVLFILEFGYIIWNGIKIETGGQKFEVYPLKRFFKKK